MPAEQAVADWLLLDPADRVVCLDLLSLAYDRPIMITTAFFPADRLPRMEEAFRRHQSITKALQEQGIDDYKRKKTSFVARLSTPSEARLLKQPKSQAVIATEVLDVDLNDDPICFQRGCLSGARVKLVLGN